LDTFDLFEVSFYYVVTTITTVGYGDISGTNTLERIICCFLMLSGVIAFSYATGTLSTIMSSYDSTNA